MEKGRVVACFMSLRLEDYERKWKKLTWFTQVFTRLYWTTVLKKKKKKWSYCDGLKFATPQIITIVTFTLKPPQQSETCIALFGDEFFPKYSTYPAIFWTFKKIPLSAKSGLILGKIA